MAGATAPKRKAARRVWRPLDPACPRCRVIKNWRDEHPEYREHRRTSKDGPARWDEVGLQVASHKRLHHVR